MSLLLAVQGGGGAVNYTLTGLAGSYSLSGGSATLTKTTSSTAYSLTGLAGTYSLTGGSAVLSVGRKITANAGTYSLSGGTATLKVARTLTANAGSYSLTGGSATLTKSTGAVSYSLTALAGSYALSGGSAGLSVGRKLTALAGSYSITGGSATMTKTGATAYTLTALAGSYSISGGSASLVWSGENSSYSNTIDLEKRWYVRRGKKLHIFSSGADADAFIEAEERADEAVKQAQKTSRLARKRLREKVFKPDVQVQTVDLGSLSSMAEHFGFPVDIPSLVAQREYERLMDVMYRLQEMQDEEDIEMLLLA